MSTAPKFQHTSNGVLPQFESWLGSQSHLKIKKSTIHAFCTIQLKKYKQNKGFPDLADSIVMEITSVIEMN